MKDIDYDEIIIDLAKTVVAGLVVIMAILLVGGLIMATETTLLICGVLVVFYGLVIGVKKIFKAEGDSAL